MKFIQYILFTMLSDSSFIFPNICPQFHGSYGQLSKKYSSCSTIYIDDSTVSNPNLKNTIKAVALAIYFLIKNRSTRDNHLLEMEGKLLDIFDEKLHPLSVSIWVGIRLDSANF